MNGFLVLGLMTGLKVGAPFGGATLCNFVCAVVGVFVDGFSVVGAAVVEGIIIGDFDVGDFVGNVVKDLVGKFVGRFVGLLVEVIVGVTLCPEAGTFVIDRIGPRVGAGIGS